MSDEKRITILMTDQAPVSIVEAQWPIIMTHGRTKSNAFDLSSVLHAQITVRRHDDGSHVVHGIGPGCQGGYLLSPGANVEHAISLLAIVIGVVNPHAFARECIQKLPAVNI